MNLYIIGSAWNYDSGGETFGIYDDKETAIKVAKEMKGHHDYILVYESGINQPIPKKDQYGDFVSLEPIWNGEHQK